MLQSLARGLTIRCVGNLREPDKAAARRKALPERRSQKFPAQRKAKIVALGHSKYGQHALPAREFAYDFFAQGVDACGARRKQKTETGLTT